MEQSGCGVTSRTVAREVLSDEGTLSGDRKEAREEVKPVTDRGLQTVGALNSNLLSRSVLGGALREGCWGEGRWGSGVLMTTHPSTCSAPVLSCRAWGETQRNSPSLPGGNSSVGGSGYRNLAE